MNLAMLPVVQSGIVIHHRHQTTPFPKGRSEQTLTIEGFQRTYILRVPPQHDGKRPLPLVIMLHGMGGSGSQAERSYGWWEKGEREGFIAVFPDALGQPRAWSSFGFPERVAGRDDVIFLEKLIAELQSRLTVDPKRIFVCGHSSGGFMSYRLGSVIPEKIAAIGVMAGSIGMMSWMGKRTILVPKSPLSVIHFHGKADDIVPYDGPANRKARFPNVVPAPDSVAFWVKADGCNPKPRTDKLEKDTIIREQYSGGKAGTEVALYTLVDGGHGWPGMRFSMSNAPATPNVTNIMWEFFKAHPKR